MPRLLFAVAISIAVLMAVLAAACDKAFAAQGAPGDRHLATVALKVGIAAATLGFSLRSSACDFNPSEGVWS